MVIIPGVSWQLKLILISILYYESYYSNYDYRCAVTYLIAAASRTLSWFSGWLLQMAARAAEAAACRMSAYMQYISKTV